MARNATRDRPQGALRTLIVHPFSIRRSKLNQVLERPTGIQTTRLFSTRAMCAAMLLQAGCGHQASPPLPAQNQSLAHFGFAVVDCGYDDPTDAQVKTNFLDEVSGFTNIGQMCVYSPDESVGDRLSRFSLAGVKALLSIQGILFDQVPDAAMINGVRTFLLADAEARWANFVSLNKDALVPEKVAALYVVDEPVWNALSSADFSRALQIVKASVPDIPTMAIEASPVVEQIMVPPELDWVGFDRYETIDPENDAAFLSDLATVRAARTRSDQKMVVIASTQWLPYFETDAGIRPPDMAAIIDSYYRVAASDRDVVALIGYLWPGGFDDPAQQGGRQLPENAQQSFREIGARIIQ